MKANFTTAALGVLALAVPVCASAQQRDPSAGGQRTQQGQSGSSQQGHSQQAQGQSMPPHQQTGAASWLSSSKITGAEVKNQAQESVGTISELVVDPNSARVIFAVVETRNFLGLNQKKYLIPWQTFRVDRNLEESDEIALVLDTTREKLEKSFEFEEDKMGSVRPEEVYSYWGQDFQQVQQQQRHQGQQPGATPSSPMRESGTDRANPSPGPGTGNPGGGATGGSGTGSGAGTSGGSGAGAGGR